MKKRIFLSMALVASLMSGCYENYQDETPGNNPIVPPTLEDVRDVDREETISLYGTNFPSIVITVNFADVQMTTAEDEIINKIYGKQFGELNNYFQKSSEYNFYLEPIAENDSNQNGLINITLPYNHIGSSGSVSDQQYKNLIVDIMEEALPYLDLNSLDKNNNNIIEQNELTTIIMIAGYEESYDARNVPNVWAHSYGITDATGTAYLEYGDYTIGSWYGLFGELHGNHSATIGIIAHELSHAILELPDLYNTDPSNPSLGIGPYGIMGSGAWGTTTINGVSEPGNTPMEYSAFSKLASGFVIPKTVIQGTDYKEYTLNSNNTNKYEMLKIEVTDKEYFLVENISNTGYNEGLNSQIVNHIGGIAIWHIDTQLYADLYDSNTVNNDPNHKAVDIEEASTLNLDKGVDPISTDLYYTGNKTIFNENTSTSNSRLYNGSISGFNLTNVSSLGKTMSVTLKNKI